ncbi:MAG: dihydroorotase [Fimbriimonas sp.]
MNYDLLIRGGRLASSSGVHDGDVGIVGNRIVAIGSLGDATAAETVDARGLVVMPGVIDTQVHFREPGLEHKEDLATGTLAALYGGVTSILEMPNTNPNTTSPETLADKLERAAGRASCHYGFFVGATAENAERLAEYERLPGTPGIKVFMGSSTGSLLVGVDEELRRVLRNGVKRVPIHAEDEARNVAARKAYTGSDPRDHPHVRDAESARLATTRILRLSEETGRPVHVLHVSTADEPPLLAEAKRRGLRTTAEVTPQHLYFAAPDCYERLGTLAQMNPPVRSAEHRDGLWRALAEGVFDVFGSDHAPHTLEEKAKPYPGSPSGMPGVQTLLPVLLTFVAQGRLRLEDVVRMACENPAALYGIRGRGRLAEGAYADLAIVDPDRSYTFERSMVRSKCGWSPYEGERLTGAVEHVVLNGRVALRSGEAAGAPTGQMLEFDGPA